MASAMTPDPTVAMVRSARGDIAAEDTTGDPAFLLGGPLSPALAGCGIDQRATADAVRKKRPVPAMPEVREPGAARAQPRGGPGRATSRPRRAAGRRRHPDGGPRGPGARPSGGGPGATRRRCPGRLPGRGPPGTQRPRRRPGRHRRALRSRRSRRRARRQAPRPTGPPRGGGRAGGGRAAGRGRGRAPRRPRRRRTARHARRGAARRSPTPAAGSTIRPASGRPSSQRVTMSSSAAQAASWMAPRSNWPRRRNQSSGKAGYGVGSRRRARGSEPATDPARRGGPLPRGGRRRRPPPSSPAPPIPAGRAPRAGVPAGTGSSPPCPGSPGTAGPSPPGRWGHASPTRPRTTGSRRSGGRPSGIARLAGACPGRGRRHAVERHGVEELGEDLDPVDHPRPGAGRTRPPSTTNTRSSRTARRSAQPSGRGVDSQARVASREREPVGEQHQHLRVHVPDGIPRGLLGGAAVLTRGAPSRRRGAPGRGSSGRRPAADRRHPAARPVAAGTRDRGAPPRSPRRPWSRSRMPSTTSSAASSASVIAPTATIAVEHALDGRRPPASARTAARPRRRRTTASHRAGAPIVPAAPVAHDDEVRVRIDEGAGVQLVTADAGPRSGPRTSPRPGGILAPVGDADQLLVQPEGEHDLRGGGQEGDDAHAASLRVGCCRAGARATGSPDTRTAPHRCGAAVVCCGAGSLAARREGFVRPA